MTTATRPSFTALLSSLMPDGESLGPVLQAAEREFGRLVAQGISTDKVHAHASTLARQVHGKEYRQFLAQTADGGDTEDACLLLRSWDAEAAFALGLIAGQVLAGGGGR